MRTIRSLLNNTKLLKQEKDPLHKMLDEIRDSNNYDTKFKILEELEFEIVLKIHRSTHSMIDELYGVLKAIKKYKLKLIMQEIEQDEREQIMGYE